MQSKKPQSERLQKFLAAAGLGSRRQCEELILDGRVEIDREIVTELGTRVDPVRQQVRVDGTVVRAPRKQYFLVHKPPGVISTAKDPWARMRVIDLVESEDRLFTVGRLDKASSGLILVTNDGELANELAHPRHGVSKTYHVTVAGQPSVEVLRKLRKGIHLAEAFVRVTNVKLKKAHKAKSILEIVLAEGRNREIRRMLARVGHKVLQLKRIAIGPVRLGDLPSGAYRQLSRDELKNLRKSASITRAKNPAKKKKASGSSTAKSRPNQKVFGTVLGSDSVRGRSNKKNRQHSNRSKRVRSKAK